MYDMFYMFCVYMQDKFCISVYVTYITYGSYERNVYIQILYRLYTDYI
jgi:hypothetical protein